MRAVERRIREPRNRPEGRLELSTPPKPGEFLIEIRPNPGMLLRIRSVVPVVVRFLRRVGN
jgi:hypothetical protein